MSTVWFRLATMLAVVAGSAGFVLAVLAWRRFRGAPFGRGLAILVPFMAAFTAYHALLLVAPGHPRPDTGSTRCRRCSSRPGYTR